MHPATWPRRATADSSAATARRDFVLESMEVAHDAARVRVPDRTQVQRALAGRALGDAGQPQPVGRRRGEAPPHAGSSWTGGPTSAFLPRPFFPDTLHQRLSRQSFTTTTCTYTLKINPRIHPQDNTTAGTWTVRAHALANDGDYITKDSAAKAKVLRSSRLTVNASPEPVKKNKTITVTGALTRANWETYKYGGYAKQPVKLQFKKKGTSTYKTLKTVKTDSKGNLRTTTKATADGYFRYSFAGTSTTPAVASAADYVDVK